MRFESLVDSIGHTPLVRLRGGPRTRAHLYAKMELMNPFGMKDRFAAHGILAAKASGALKPGDKIIESSSGTLALGLAMVGGALGHEVHIVTDPRIDQLTLARLQALGTVVHIVEQMSSSGWQGARLARLAELLEEHPSAFWPQQYTNPANPDSYRPLAEQLLADLGQVDLLVGSVGSGGSLCGTARTLREANPKVQVVAVDAVNSVIFDQRDDPRRLQSGLGNSLVPTNVDKSLLDQVHWLNDEEAFAATLRLVADEQIFAGNSSGSAYWVARWLSTQCDCDATIVVILPDRGDRYYQTIYDPVYREEHGVDQLRLPEQPCPVSFGTLVSTWSYADLSPVDRPLHSLATPDWQ